MKNAVYISLLISSLLVWAAPAHANYSTFYVSVDGNDANAGTNWVTALKTISNAVAKTQTSWLNTILVSNGTYYLTAGITLSRLTTMRGFTNNGPVVVDGQNSVRPFILTSTGEVLDGLSITHGYGTGSSGGGVNINLGLVTNCLIYGNMAYDAAATYGGGGVILSTGAKIANCRIFNNISSNCNGGGVLNLGGTVMNCVIVNNVATNAANTASGGGISGYGTTIGTNINNLIANNVAGRAGGVYSVGKESFINCTIVSNVAYQSGGGYYKYNDAANYGTSLVENTIIYFNQNPGGTSSNYLNHQATTATRFLNSCVSPEITGYCTNFSTNNIFADPQFAGVDSGDWHLTRSSPCVNAGANESWMINGVDLENSRRLDKFSGIVDMGAYEFIPQGTMVTIH
jgi:hypothetical protein